MPHERSGRLNPTWQSQLFTSSTGFSGRTPVWHPVTAPSNVMTYGYVSGPILGKCFHQPNHESKMKSLTTFAASLGILASVGCASVSGDHPIATAPPVPTGLQLPSDTATRVCLASPESAGRLSVRAKEHDVVSVTEVRNQAAGPSRHRHRADV